MREVPFIETALSQIGRFLRSRYADRDAVRVSAKHDPVDMLTEVDLEVQRRLQRAIWAEFPGDFILAEEDGFDRFPEDRAARCWILDPIDGTHNFVRGMLGSFGVSVGFAVDGRVQAAGIAFPELDLCFTAGRGMGAMCNGAVTNVSDGSDVSRAQVEMDFGRPDFREPILDATPRLLRYAGQIRCHGSAVFGLCSVAAGHADAYVHAGLKTWDWAAAALIVEEAGGTVTDFHGQPLKLFENESAALLASNGQLHEAALNLLDT